MKLEPSLDTLQAPVELRVLVGPQAGSCLSLSVGEYNLGTSDECEIILIGPRLEAIHAKLGFDGNQITIAPGDGKICDAQGNEITDTFPLALGMPVDLGGIWVSVDNADALWPDPTDILPVPAKPAPSTSDDPEGKTPNGPIDHTGSQLRKRAKIILASSALALILVASTGIIIAAWLVKQPQRLAPAPVATTPAKPAVPTSQKKIQQIIANLDLAKSVEAKVSGQGVVTVSGYVSDVAIKTQLMNALENILPKPQTDLYVDSELLASARKILDEKLDPSRAKLRAEGVNEGLLRVEGAVLMQSVKDSVFETLRSEVPGLRQVEGSVLVADDLPQQFQEKILAAGLTKKLQVVSRQPDFILRGAMTEDELHRWEKLLVEFDKDYGKILPIKATIRLIRNNSPVNLEVIVGGSMPFVITENGNRVTRGGDINGHTLIMVKDTEVIFDGNEKLKISR
jgi:type III secretion system YscD/HrpQ family protein